ncbi:hypothetical protein AM500_20980 [Bacillus sp. FJAT-18017]|uniref:hypothetical protein n=1 Tax=unclassified Bacillus (in: firmicutes) TaxID=185979 RepID=UPI0005C63F86|nr:MULTISPECIES: hypothetical protein [unclassified Bacillus (in: firmicutes)]ALC91988.1 hypothetical protein AM500_20980 [Bacillus sp. FJAT-18017]
MLKQVELSDYHLWMCQQIREKLAERNRISPLETFDYTERDLVTIALSELVFQLNTSDPAKQG